MIACRIKEGKDGKGKGGEKRNKGKNEKGHCFQQKQKAPSAHSLPALAEGVRHLIAVAIKCTFTGVLLYARH